MEIRPTYYTSREGGELVPWTDSRRVDLEALGKYHGQDVFIPIVGRVHALFWYCGLDEHGISVYWRWDRINGFTGPQSMIFPNGS